MKRICLIAISMAILLSLSSSTESQRRRRGGSTVAPRTTDVANQAIDRAASQQELSPLSLEQQKRLSERLLEQPAIASKFRGQRIRALSVTAVAADKIERPQRVANIVVFNYSQGTATRFLVDAETGAPLAEETLRGRPQASPEEREEARDLIRRQDELRSLMRDNVVIQGGFIVDDPRGANSRNRYIQFHILSSDQRRILRQVVVDLTERKLADKGR